MSHNNYLSAIIARAGGKVEDRYVTKHGIMIFATTKLEENTMTLPLLWECGIPLTEDYTSIAEFNSRLTYLAFSKEQKDGNPPSQEKSDAYNKKMIDYYGHYSVHSSYHVTFIIAGLSTEAAMEMIAHSEAKVSRLTTSKTKAMEDPIYYVGSNEDLQNTIATQNSIIGGYRWYELSTEDENRLNPGQKAIALTYTMSLKDFHKLFIGRISDHGVEEEVRVICEEMCRQLHDRYPIVIKSPEDYFAMGNREKYNA